MSLPIYTERQIWRKAISIERCSALGVQSEDLEKCIFRYHYRSGKKWESRSKLNSNLCMCLWNVLFNNVWNDKHIFTSFFFPHRVNPWKAGTLLNLWIYSHWSWEESLTLCSEESEERNTGTQISMACWDCQRKSGAAVTHFTAATSNSPKKSGWQLNSLKRDHSLKKLLSLWQGTPGLSLVSLLTGLQLP